MLISFLEQCTCIHALADLVAPPPRPQGPESTLKVAGEEVLEIWPIFPNLIPQLLCVSYAGMFYMTITVDDKVVIQVWFHAALTSAAQSSSVGLIPTCACAVCVQPEMLATLYLDELKQLASAVGAEWP